MLRMSPKNPFLTDFSTEFACFGIGMVPMLRPPYREAYCNILLPFLDMCIKIWGIFIDCKVILGANSYNLRTVSCIQGRDPLGHIFTHFPPKNILFSPFPKFPVYIILFHCILHASVPFPNSHPYCGIGVPRHWFLRGQLRRNRCPQMPVPSKTRNFQTQA